VGSYAHFEIDGHSFFECKSSVDPTLMTLFEECDKQVFARPISDRNPRTWIVTSFGDESENETVYHYSLEARVAKRRLEILGFTLEECKIEFADGVKRIVDDSEDRPYFGSLHFDSKDEFLRFAKNYTYEYWLDGIRRFLAISIDPRLMEDEDKSQLDPVLRLISNWADDDLYYGFPIGDPRLFVRAVVEAIDVSASVRMDYTELVHSGYYDGTESLAEDAKESVRHEFISSTRIMILTEGSSDAEFLKSSLMVLFPKIAPLYSFLDFSGPKMEGGAANLVRILKAFVGSGVANRVIALLDNDTAARDALKALNGVELPPNIRVMSYPDLDYAREYPTIGPQGVVDIDVNGLAGSVELYFGIDVLRQEDGQLTPVQWRGYNESLKRYQGELQDKRNLHDKFRIKAAAACSSGTDNQDWSGMQAILDAVFSAFH